MEIRDIVIVLLLLGLAGMVWWNLTLHEQLHQRNGGIRRLEEELERYRRRWRK
jgi:hypothetical protein